MIKIIIKNLLFFGRVILSTYGKDHDNNYNHNNPIWEVVFVEHYYRHKQTYLPTNGRIFNLLDNVL